MNDSALFDVIELIYEYQLLRNKRDTLGIELSDEERGRLIGLGRLLEDRTSGAPGPRRHARVELHGPIQFTSIGGFGSAQLRDVGGGGMAVATDQPLVEGMRTVVRLVDALGGREFIFPCRVSWSAPNGEPTMGLAFDGVPLRTHFQMPPPGEWRQGLQLGSGVGEPLFA